MQSSKKVQNIPAELDAERVMNEFFVLTVHGATNPPPVPLHGHGNGLVTISFSANGDEDALAHALLHR